MWQLQPGLVASEMNALFSSSMTPLTTKRAADLVDLGYTPQCPPLQSLVANKFDGDEHQVVAGATLFWGSGTKELGSERAPEPGRGLVGDEGGPVSHGPLNWGCIRSRRTV